MNLNTFCRATLRFLLGAFAVGVWQAPCLQARTITLNLELARLQYSAINPYYNGQTYYTVNVLVSSDLPAVTYDEVDSPAPASAYSGTESGYGQSYYGDIPSALNAATNGVWTLTVNKGDVSEKQYTFTVSATGLDSTNFPAVQITVPADGNPAVSTNTSFIWTGPGSWDELEVQDHNLDYSFFSGDVLSPSTTNWTPTSALPLGTNEFEVTYKTNASPFISISTPVDNLLQPFTNWVAGEKLVDFAQSGFVTSPNPAEIGTSHTLVAHYAFEDGSNTYQLGLDSSPNGNNLSGYSYWGPVHTNNADAAAGTNAVEFFGNSSMNANDQVLTNLNAVLAGSFTFSVWVKTTAIWGSDYDNAYFGATIFWAFNDSGGTNDTIPLAITGSKAAFTTRDHLGNFDTLHSITGVNDGNYHLITVTRDQTTGEKRIYVDGHFENSEFGTTDPLNGNNYFLTIGGTTSSSYTGLLDDLQIYSGVLSSSEVMQLYKNPGGTIPNVTAGSGIGPTAYYDFDEGTVLAPDISGHGNNIVHAGNFGGSGPSISSDTIAGAGSVSFDGGSYLTATNRLLPTLAGSFSISLWVKTTQDNGDPNDLAWTGDCIISADSPNAGANDLIPVALTGGQVAFNTANTEYDYDDTINSSALVNDGQWHHVVVSRNQPTGDKFIYIDGVLDTSDTDSTNLLNDPQLLTIGCKADASNPDPASPDYTGENGYDGLVDDIQIYNRVLTPGDVSYLYNHPGSVLATNSSSEFNVALNTTNLNWTTGGDAPWFIETYTNYDGISAAQSGMITDGQTSWIETTVPADGDLSFYWKVSSEQDWDFLTFYINGVEQDAISGDMDWNQETYSVAAGDVVRWEYTKDPDCCSDGADAGWLDQVVLPPGAGSTTPYPVDVNLQFSITRTQDPNLGEIYGGSVGFNSINPEPSTTNSVHSPHDYFNTEVYPGGGDGGGAILSSLNDVINEFTNGVWTMYINQGSPTQQVYTFQIAITNLDTNVLKAVKVFMPTNGAVNISTNPAYYWTGPSNFTTLQVGLLSGPSASLPVTATNWPLAPSLGYGTNRFDVTYTNIDIGGVTFTTPVDASSNPVRTWTATADLISASFNIFVVGAPAPLPVLLTNITRINGDVQFSFQTLAGRPHTVQSRTNLVTGNWVDVTNFTGDGSIQQFKFQATNPPTQFFRVKTK